MAALLMLAGCDGPQSVLMPAGPAARMVADLWWGMLVFSMLVLLVVVGLWIHAIGRSPRRYDDKAQLRIHRRWIIGGGIILPIASIGVLLAFGIPAGHRMLPLPLAGEPPLRIEVTGRQWQFEVRYPDSGIAMVDRIVIPAGHPVDIHVTSADVIHAFWVPRLGGKIDMLPGRSNVLRLQADAPGEYRGQCAEFCGARHAHMQLTVLALDRTEFNAWLEGKSR